MEEFKLTEQDVEILNSNKGLTALFSKEPYNLEKALRYVKYEKKLKKLQVELIRLQTWAIHENERIIIIFEGRDAAGKGGAIRRAIERMITESGIRLVKIYMSISKKEQEKRFEDIKSNPLKQWKMTAVDEAAQELWDTYTDYKGKMFAKTVNGVVPWKIIRANKKTIARVNAINHILKNIPYDKNLEI